ncbi:MAG: FG-GAP-like repeat-containing protein [Bacteroidales bacterium]|nr:FG-GAP-like repeat-containing protein [Bacteroidales bacterium]
MSFFVNLVRLNLQWFGRMSDSLIFLSVFLCVFHSTSGFPQVFTKVNSGTKSDIRQLKITPDGTGYFLTDKIFAFDGKSWKKADFPVAGLISTFDAISMDNIWYSTSLETSTSMLYHYHNGVTETIHAPFANDITSVFFQSENLVFFASYSDVVIYKNREFEKFIPAVMCGIIKAIYGTGRDKFWVLNQSNKMFFCKNGQFLNIFPDKTVNDFQFLNTDHGFLLTDEAIIEIQGMNIIREFRNNLLKDVKKIQLHGDEIWVIGTGGLILILKDGLFRRINYEGKENLNALGTDGNGDIWIAGDNGLLLYSGKKHFPAYDEYYPGFSAQKLTSFGIVVDNEYGVAFADFNGDNKTDIYTVCISDPNKLFINQTNPKLDVPLANNFREEAVKRGASGLVMEKDILIPSELKLGVSVADVDNDGDEDIYLSSLNSHNKLLLNNGHGYFRNVSNQNARACENVNRCNAAAFADVDLDGDLDLFVTSEQGPNRFFINDGNGYFTDVTETAGVASSGAGMCATFGDVNDDGYPDLVVTFWYPSNKIYLNESRNGQVKFRDITLLTDLPKAGPAKSNAVVLADVNNDGHPDLFIANRHAVNRLYLNDGKGIFRDETSRYFENKVYLTNGAVFADFDLDGYQDLYITNVGDNVMYKNIDGKYFEDVTGKFGAEMSGYCTGSAVGDVDNDGDVDLYAANYINGSSMMFLNKMEKRNSVTFKLQGTRSNRNAIGAKIYLYVVRPERSGDSLAGFREIRGGGGYCSISAKEAVFSLTPELNYYAVVLFPASGIRIKIDKITNGSVIRVSEETGFAAYKTLSEKALVRFLTDREIQLEIAKYVAVLLILLIYLYIQRRGSRQMIVTRFVLCLALFIIFSLVNQFFLFSSSILLFSLVPSLAVMGLIILHLVTERILLKRQAERDKKELREKISRDLHDDLASTLGSISIYSNTLKGMTDATHPTFKKLSVKIAELTQTALQSITDIIWMTAPRNDSLQHLLSKASAMMFDVLTDNNIRFKEKIELPEQDIILRDNIRHDTFLILKEALNNVIRHASPQMVTLSACLFDKICKIQLTDDGQGFREDELLLMDFHGNGLINMHRRAADSGIELQVHSTPGFGSRIEISFRI